MEDDMEESHMVGKAFHPKRRINKKTKLNLVFDPEARKQFLTGFHKRKVHRQKKAQEELKEQILEERRKLRKEARETYKKLVVSYQPVPEVENLLSEEHNLTNHSVTITELSTSDLAEKNNWIGENKVQYEETKKECDDGSNDEEEVQGMELKSRKDIKKIVKKQATKTVQKSKAFQTKNKIEQRKMRKKSSKLKSQRIKIREKGKGGRGRSRGMMD